MRFDIPATTNPIDQMKVVGKPLTRIDGGQKTSGAAPYAHERHDVAGGQLYGYPIGAAIAKGRIVSMDTTAAEAAPGIVGVVTAPEVGPHKNGPMNTALLFGGDEVQHYHQAIALVVAETFEQARAAAAMVTVEYESADGQFDLAAAAAEMEQKPIKPEQDVGDFEAAFAKAPVTLDAHYHTPDHSHASMEPHASIASWDGNNLTVWTTNQMIAWGRRDLAKVMGIKRDNVRMDSPYIGGGFGGKLFVRSDVAMAAHGARKVGRPVKVALPRPLIANNTTHRPATLQRIRIGADHDGKITAICHEAASGNLEDGSPEEATLQTQLLYAAPNRKTIHRLAVLDLPEGHAMRAPGEAPGMMALEVAMDEMAEKLGMDPVEFRIINDTQVDPAKPDRRFSQRHLIECLRTGADRFGWSARNAVPGQQRQGDWLVGMGVAAAFRNNLVFKSAARVKLDSQGVVTVETDMTEIGTGSYTIIAQTAAEMMGVTVEQVVVRLGDSNFPVSAGSGGQFGANCSTSGVYAACVKLREAVAKRLGLNAEGAVFANGHVRSGDRSIPLSHAATEGEIVVEDAIEFGDLDKEYQQSTFGSHFVEVAVHAATGEIRVRRMLAVCDAGRILNPLTARSQVIGAMTMGVGLAIMEELAVDKRRGFFVNHDLAGYEVPVHADIPEQDVIFLDHVDPISSPMKAKGIGELGLCGVSAAIANAIYNATGVRVRDYPVTLDKLLSGLPPL